MHTSPLFLTGFFALLLSLNACKNDPQPQVAAQKPKVDTIQVPAPSNEKPTEFVLMHGAVTWSGRKSLGDAHEGTLSVKKGSLLMRSQTLVSGKFTMDMQSIAVTDITDVGERRDLESHLKDDDFFETEKFPEAEFIITEALPSSMPEFNWLVIGDLTMKGKTNPVRIPIKITIEGDKLRAVSPTFPIQRTLWGINFRSGILGTAKDKMIDDNVMLSLTLEAKKVEMTQVLLANAYFYRYDEKQWKTGQPFPPYGTLSAAACLREAGFEVQLFDVSLRSDPGEIAAALQAQRPRFLVIYDDGFNYLTKMCLTRMREAAMHMAKIGQAFGCTVVVNSSDSTDHFAVYLQQGADFVVLGEGEITLRELLISLEAGENNFHHLPGIAFVPAGEAAPLKTAPRPVLGDLDQLPDPAWDLIDIEGYRRIWQQRHGRFTLNLATTRGCPYKCNWCAKPIYGNRYNSRSPERVVGEIKWLIDHFQVRDFWMADDIFGLKPGWVQRFGELVRKQQLSFTFKIQSRVDLLLKEDNIAALADAGLRQVWVGAESGAQSVLDAMDKGTTVDEIKEATRLCKKKGVEVCFFLQFGYLGETKKDIMATMNMVDDLQPDDIGISVSYPLPGTKFFEMVRSQMGEKKNWTVSDDLDMMYPSTFGPAYYKRLHRLVHKRFRMQQGIREWVNLIRTGNGRWKPALKVLYYAPAAWLDALWLRRLEQHTTSKLI